MSILFPLAQKDKRLKGEFLDPTDRLMGIIKSRKAAALFMSSQNEARKTAIGNAYTVFADIGHCVEGACKKGGTEKRPKLRPMHLQEVPEAREARRHQLCAEVALSRLEKAMTDATLSAAQWYHGLLPREDIKTFLRCEGDFLVRMSEPKEPGRREFVLSVMFDSKNDVIKHFVINRTITGKYSIDKEVFDSVVDLVKHYIDTKQSLTPHYKVIVARPTSRRSWQLDHVDIESTKKLGEGAFGEVHKGTLKLRRGGKKVDVAIKLAKLDVMTKEQIKDIMREARLMRDFNHPNVVRLYGVAATQEPLMLVMELASNGALDSYLQKNECMLDKKMEMCTQSAWGIEYLHEKNCLHRDIASRNCLYGDGKVKISDFGLSRIGGTYQMNPKCRVPIRWLAPETLRTAMYSQKTDVWSFGIMCWEILNNGQEPYPGMMVAEVHVKVKEGYRMSLEWPGIDHEFVSIINNRCWAENPQERYSMSDIARGFEAFTKIPRPVFVDDKKDGSRDCSRDGRQEKEMTGRRKKK